jgi:hypothetical protein
MDSLAPTSSVPRWHASPTASSVAFPTDNLTMRASPCRDRGPCSLVRFRLPARSATPKANCREMDCATFRKLHADHQARVT